MLSLFLSDFKTFKELTHHLLAFWGTPSVNVKKLFNNVDEPQHECWSGVKSVGISVTLISREEFFFFVPICTLMYIKLFKNFIKLGEEHDFKQFTLGFLQL